MPWVTIAEAAKLSNVHRTTLNKALSQLGDDARKSGGTWLINTDGERYQAWLAGSNTGRPRQSITVILKAQGPGPSYAFIRRVGTSMSDPRDERNHMLLSDEQEFAYQQAVRFVEQGDIEAARYELEKVFEKVIVERPE
jgi:hypothetical protein